MKLEGCLIRIICILSFIFASACHTNHGSELTKINDVVAISADIQIPQSFIKIIEEDLLVETKILSPVYIFVPLQILFTEKTALTLKGPSLQFNLPKGGGAIDLQDVVSSQGSFFMSFPPGQFKSLPELEHLFFVSDSPRTRISNEDFGTGCGKWLDIKSKFLELQNKNFLALNTTDLRHLFVMAGHYVFVFRKLNQIYLSQLTITDSKHRNQLCPHVKGSDL